MGSSKTRKSHVSTPLAEAWVPFEGEGRREALARQPGDHIPRGLAGGWNGTAVLFFNVAGLFLDAFLSDTIQKSGPQFLGPLLRLGLKGGRRPFSSNSCKVSARAKRGMLKVRRNECCPMLWTTSWPNQNRLSFPFFNSSGPLVSRSCEIAGADCSKHGLTGSKGCPPLGS